MTSQFFYKLPFNFNREKANIIFSSTIGGVLEFYELTVFGFLAPVLSKVFFWPGCESSKIFTYMVFAIGFVFRPLGAIIFGHLGDKYTRKLALYVSILLMGCATCAIGMLPGTQDIGISAPLTLIFLRILQGISAGGEFNGAIIIVVENISEKRRGLISSFVGSSGMLGIIIGGFVSNIIMTSSHPEFFWRYAFLPGIALSILSLWLRTISIGVENPFESEKKAKIPLLEAFRDSFKEIIAAFLVAGYSGLIIYTKTIFESGLNPGLKSGSTTITFLLMIIPPVCAYFSDLYGRKKIMLSGLVGMILLFIFSLMSLLKNNTTIFIYCVCAGLFMGPMHAWMIEKFKYSSRYSAIGFSYSLGMGVLGGTAPLAAQYLHEIAPAHNLLSLYMIFMGVLTLIFYLKVEKRK